MIQSSRILIVDDEPFNVDYLEQELEDLGYTTASARNGREALDKVTAQAPDLILLDVMMPGMDGWQVCREMKSSPMGRDIRVIMVTALQDWMDKRQAIETGADDYVEKPFELAKLAAVVERNVAQLHQTR